MLKDRPHAERAVVGGGGGNSRASLSSAFFYHRLLRALLKRVGVGVGASKGSESLRQRLKAERIRSQRWQENRGCAKGCPVASAQHGGARKG